MGAVLLAGGRPLIMGAVLLADGRHTYCGCCIAC